MIFVVFPPLKDDDPYVRKTAAICVAKLFDINAELVQDRGFVDTLKEMLGDSNPMVVANAGPLPLAGMCRNPPPTPMTISRRDALPPIELTARAALLLPPSAPRPHSGRAGRPQ